MTMSGMVKNWLNDQRWLQVNGIVSKDGGLTPPTPRYAIHIYALNTGCRPRDNAQEMRKKTAEAMAPILF